MQSWAPQMRYFAPASFSSWQTRSRGAVWAMPLPEPRVALCLAPSLVFLARLRLEHEAAWTWIGIQQVGLCLKNSGAPQCLFRGNWRQVFARAAFADNLHGESIGEARRTVNAAAGRRMAITATSSASGK